MNRLRILAVLLPLAAACSEKPAGEPQPAAGDAAAREIAALKAEVARLAAENEQLRQTPAMMAAEVDAAVRAGDAQRAQSVLKRLVERYPASPEVNPSIQRVDTLVARLRAQQEEARRVAAEGFRALKVQPVFTHGDTSVNVRSAEIGRSWRFDHYGNAWKYLEAQKGHRFVLARVTVTSQAKEPTPFGIGAYVADGATLRLLGQLRYRFARWQDFGSYLGTHADYRNDFAHASSIPFSLGVEVAEDDLKRRPVYLVATREGCHVRTYARGAQPPVHYAAGACATLKPTLEAADFTSGALAVVRRID